MMVGAALFAVAAFVVTNAPSSFSTMVERTMPCPIVSEPKVGMKFDLDLPQSSGCQIEVAVGRDADGDGYSNRDEWWAGSDPNDAQSVFRIDSATVGTARRITFSWPSCEGRTYTVWRANRLGDPFMLYRDGIEATPPENEITLPSDDADSAFYRIGVR